MRWNVITWLPVATIASPVFAMDYATVEETQARLFPDVAFAPAPITLTEADRAALRDASGVREPFDPTRIWRGTDGSVVVVDEVVGKHEKILYAVGIEPSGHVRGIEILNYRETYGGEVRDAAWRTQFVGRSSESPPVLGETIRNVSGATLSCKHVTDGVRRVLALYARKLAR